MKTKPLFISLALGLILPWLLSGSTPPAQADSPHYVAPGGICGGVTPCHATIQEAVDAAVFGDEIRVASGVYTDVNNYGGLAQMVYISKAVTIRGGYTTSNWTTPYPITQPTTLDAQGQGRVLYITGDISPTVEGLRITGGDATGLGGTRWGNDAGGGMYIITATATISNSLFFSNTAYNGGGLFLYESATTLSGNTIMSNTAEGGGGLFLYDSAATFSGNTVMSNAAGWGGGVFLGGGANTLSRNTIVSNTASHTGGGLYLDSSDSTLNGNAVLSNAANSHGGGLDSHNSDATFINTIIADNRAGQNGSGLRIYASLTHLLHTTIARNSGGNGIGVYITDNGWDNATVFLTNTILVSHTVGINVTAGNPLLGSNTATLEATLWGSGDWANGTDWGGTGTIITGTHNYWGDPAFVNPNAGDYHITAASEARDAGVNAGVDDDIDGDPRPQGGGYDIGADESLSAAPGDHKNYLPLITRQYP
jgi:parallel beta-helix repeat protein